MISIIISVSISMLATTIGVVIYAIRQEGKLKMCELEICNLKKNLDEDKINFKEILNKIDDIGLKLERVITIIDMGDKHAKN